MRFPVRIFLIPLFFILYSLFLLKPAFAQTIPPSLIPDQAGNDNAKNFVTPNTNSDVPKNLHNWTQIVMIDVMSSMMCQLIGVDPASPNQKCLGYDAKTGKIGFVENGGGAIGLTGFMISRLYTPPAQTRDYASYLSQNFGIARPAYAQGIGFNGLRPIVKIWEAFRNIVYLIFVLVFIVVGLAIMFRVKIDPRTVMTIENQLPRIIVGILLVTFSFPIAGFLIDVMYVSMYVIFGVVANIPATGGVLYNVQHLNPSALQGKNALEAFGGLAGTGNMDVADMTNTVAGNIKDIFKNLLGVNCPDAISCAGKFLNPFDNITSAGTDLLGFSSNSNTVGNILFGLIGQLAGFGMFFNIAHVTTPGTGVWDSFGTGILIDKGKLVTGAIAGEAVYAATQLLLREFLPFFLAWLIIFIAVLWAMIRLWFTLISAYIFILLDVVLGPFLILFGVFPGKSLFFGWWVRDLLANLSVFPATLVIFLLGNMFVQAFKNPGGDMFVPPMIGDLSTGNNLIGSIIGLGVILLAPQIVSMMRETIKAPQFKYTAGIGQALGTGPGIVGGAWHATSSQYGGLAQVEHFKTNVLGKSGALAGIGNWLRGKVAPTGGDSS